MVRKDGEGEFVRKVITVQIECIVRWMMGVEMRGEESRALLGWKGVGLVRLFQSVLVTFVTRSLSFSLFG